MAEQNDVVRVQRDHGDRTARVELLKDVELERAAEEASQCVDSKHEELRGQGVTLAQAAAVPDRRPGNAI